MGTQNLDTCQDRGKELAMLVAQGTGVFGLLTSLPKFPEKNFHGEG